MMSGKEKILWGLAVYVLVFLYLASSTNLIIKEKKVQIHRVSIILDDVNDSYYQNFKKGVEQAAREYHVDTSYITLYEEDNCSQQIELVKREINDQAEAVVIVPVNREAVEKEFGEKKWSTPIIAVGSGTFGDSVNSNIYTDCYEAGRMLAGEAQQELGSEVVYYLFAQDFSWGNSQLVFDGVKNVLEEAGAEYIVKEKSEGQDFRSVIESMVYPATTQKVALIALDRESLTEISDIFKVNEGYRLHVEGVYGVGSTTSLLNSLESGIIDGLITQNQYLSGYLSIQKAVEAIGIPNLKENVKLDSYYITRENMRSREYERMLYPME